MSVGTRWLLGMPSNIFFLFISSCDSISSWQQDLSLFFFCITLLTSYWEYVNWMDFILDFINVSWNTFKIFNLMNYLNIQLNLLVADAYKPNFCLFLWKTMLEINLIVDPGGPLLTWATDTCLLLWPRCYGSVLEMGQLSGTIFLSAVLQCSCHRSALLLWYLFNVTPWDDCMFWLGAVGWVTCIGACYQLKLLSDQST